MNKKEQYAFISGNAMPVTPDKNNKFDESKPQSSGYNISDGKFFDPVDQKTRNFDAAAHTHPIGNSPSGPYPAGNINTQEWIHPSKPGFVI